MLACRQQWEKVGQVCGAAGAGEMQTGGKSINGQQYDHVIDVDISDGAAPLKLGVNRNDNPYQVADRYISYSMRRNYMHTHRDGSVCCTHGK